MPPARLSLSPRAPGTVVSAPRIRFTVKNKGCAAGNAPGADRHRRPAIMRFQIALLLLGIVVSGAAQKPSTAAAGEAMPLPLPPLPPPASRAAAHQQACRLLTFRMTPTLQAQDARRSRLEFWTCTTSCVRSTSKWGGAGCRSCTHVLQGGPGPALSCEQRHCVAPCLRPSRSSSTILCSVPLLKWDAALAAKAQAHANKCSWGHSNGRTLYPNGESIVRRGRGAGGLLEA